MELATAQIAGNSVHPGAVSTPKIGSTSTDDPAGDNKLVATIPLPRYGQPEEVTNLMLLLASDESS